MELIVRHHKGRNREFPVYTEEEAIEKQLTYVHWKQVKPGEWALTDDGYVCECLSRNTYKRGSCSSVHLTIACGNVWGSAKSLSFLDRKFAGAYNRAGIAPVAKYESKKQRSKRFAKVMAHMEISGKIDWTLAGKTHMPESEIPAYHAKKLIKNKYIRKMVDEQIETILAEEGFTSREVIKLGKEIIDLAKKKENIPELRKMWEKLVDMYNLAGKSPREIPSNHEVLHDIEQKLIKESTNGKRTENPSPA